MGNQPGSREKILTSAKELFYRVGIQATSVDHILAQCNVSKSNFYYHFKSKDDLVYAVLEMRIQEQEARTLASLRNRELTPPARLKAFLEQICTAHHAVEEMGGCPLGNFAASLPSGMADERHEQYRLFLRDVFRRLEEAVADCLAEGMQDGHFRTDITPRRFASFVVTSVQGALMLSKTYREPERLLCNFDVLTRLLIPAE